MKSKTLDEKEKKCSHLKTHINFIQEGKKFSIVLKAKSFDFQEQPTKGERHPLDLVLVAHLANVFKHKTIKILTPEQIIFNQ